jgi:hypothetical protein
MQFFGGTAQATAAGNFGEVEGETRKWTHAAPVHFFATGQ